MLAAYNFSVLLFLVPYYPFYSDLLKFLNKEASKVIFMQEFEMILSQTQSLSIKGSLVLRTFQIVLRNVCG
jgi:hypothetical protein